MVLVAGAWSHTGEAWRSVVSHCFAGLVPVSCDGEVAGTIVALTLGDVSVFDARGNTQVVHRTIPGARRQPLDLLKVNVLVRGRAVVEQDGSQVTIRPGEMALYDTSRPYRIQFTGPWHCAVMTVPRVSLGLPEQVLADLMRRPHQASVGAGRLLAGYLRECTSALGAVAGGAHSRLGEAGVALLAGALAQDGSPVAAVDVEVVRRRVVEYIRTNVRHPDLSPENIATAHHLSLRTVQRLFEGHERNVAALIREYRLEAIRRDLADPLLADHKIATIAARYCVTNQPWLSRAFKDRFGMSPSDYRTVGTLDSRPMNQVVSPD